MSPARRLAVLLVAVWAISVRATDSGTADNSTGEGGCPLEDEEEAPSHADKSMALTLMSSILFMMSLYYLINWPDEDIREYTYNILSATISIFAAVLTFQSFNDMLNSTIGPNGFGWLEDTEGGVGSFIAGVCHMLFWYIFLQVFLAYCSGAVERPRIALRVYIRKLPSHFDPETKTYRSHVATRDKMGSLADAFDTKEITKLDQHEIQTSMKANMKCFAVLLAHMTGFAGINAWGCMQQLPFFRSKWYLSLLVIPAGLLFQIVLQRIMDKIRKRISLSDDGEIDMCEEVWDEEVEDAENDVMGLTASFLLVQSLRFSITGTMPNVEGKEPNCILENHSVSDLCILSGAALIFALVMFIMKLFEPESFAEYEKKEESLNEEGGGLDEALLKQGDKRASVQNPAEVGGGNVDEGAGEKEEEEDTWMDLAQRYWMAALTIFGMCFAWCGFYAARALVAKTAWEGEMLSVALAVIVSLVCFGFIFVLDKMADAEWTGPKADKAIKLVISAMGILIGFAWEQSFDESVAAISADFPNPHVAKLVFGCLCVIIVVPAWRLYMLPATLEKGYACGFIVNDKNVENMLQYMINEKWEPHGSEVGSRLKKLEWASSMTSGEATEQEEELSTMTPDQLKQTIRQLRKKVRDAENLHKE